MEKPKAILFDWDNTLVDSWPVIHESLNKTFIAMGHEPWSFEDVKNGREGIHHSLRDSFPRLFSDRWEEAKEIYFSSFLETHLEKISIIQGANIIVEELSKSDIYLAIVSNKTGKHLREEVKHIGWHNHFSKVIGATDAKKDKPSPEPVYLALKDTDIDTQDVWFVGDSETDIECALKAGCTPIYFGNEDFPSNYIDKKHVIKHIKTHSELLDLVKNF